MKRNVKKLCALVAVFAVVMLVSAVALAANWSSFPLQREGSVNDYVRAIKTVVKYYNPTTISVNTNYNSGTKAAVITYQSNSGFGTSDQDGIVGSQTWSSMYGRLSSATRINNVGNGSPDNQGGYYGYKVYQRASSSYTNTYFFRVDANHQNWFDVYVAASGSAPGTWYWINPRV